MSEKDIRIPVTRGDENQEGNAENESLRVDADVAKLAADLEDLRQTLLRRQADFDNYKKRIEKDNELLDLPPTQNKVIGADELQSKDNALARMIGQENSRLDREISGICRGC